MRLFATPMIKLFLALLITCALMTPVDAQQRHDHQAQGKGKNREPVINSLTASFATVPIPCPGWRKPNLPCSPSGSYVVSLATEAYDPDGDKLFYTYFVADGRIVGEGANVAWDYSGIFPGRYPIKVVVKDDRGGLKSKSLIVNVIPCPVCDPPCPSISVASPNDVEEGQPAIFTASLTGGDPDLKLTYDWSTSLGKIMSGQGTNTIEIDTAGLAGQDLKASIKVGGAPPECQAVASSTTHVRKKPDEPK